MQINGDIAGGNMTDPSKVFDIYQHTWKKLSKLGYITTICPFKGSIDNNIYDPTSYHKYLVYQKMIGNQYNLGGVQVTIFITPDEWYYVKIYVYDDDTLLYYKCDQLDGLLTLHQDIEDDLDFQKFWEE